MAPFLGEDVDLGLATLSFNVTTTNSVFVKTKRMCETLGGISALDVGALRTQKLYLKMTRAARVNRHDIPIVSMHHFVRKCDFCCCRDAQEKLDRTTE